MINFPRNRITKISGMESSTKTSAVSPTSSFRKLELSKHHDCGDSRQNQSKPERRCGQHQQLKKDDHTNQIEKSSLKSQDDIDDSSATHVSGIDPVVVKTVNFERTARVRRVRPRDQYSKKEREDMWYSDTDYSNIKKRAIDTVKRMIKGERSGGFVDDDNYTARGLECRMKKTAVERKEFKAYARYLVLEEQQNQYDLGINNSGRLRKVYLKASSISSTKAQDAGRKDSEAVNDVSLCEIRRIVCLEHNKY